MRTTQLIVLGACAGALGAWLVLDEEPGPPVSPVGDQATDPASDNESAGRDIIEALAGAAADDAPPGDAVESLRVRAETAPRDAFAAAILLDDTGLRTRTLLYSARAWARRSPAEALAQAAELPEALRTLVRSAVAEEWAFVDPAGFLAYAESVDSVEPIIAGLEVLLATDPERVLAIADRHARPVGSVVDALYLSVVRALAARDPAGTVARFQTLATGQRRDPVLTSIAQGYAGTDPDAALAWVLSVRPRSPDAVSAVIRVIAVEDPLRAYEVVQQNTGAGLTLDSLRWMLAAAAMESQREPAALADALVQRYDTAFSDPLVSALLNSWVRQAPDSAMAWLNANRANVTGEAVTIMASDLAFEDVLLAASLVDRVPPEFQYQWLEHTARRYAQFDPDGAVDWISRFEARSDYGELLNQMVLFGASSNGRFAADLIESAGDAISSTGISFTGNFYAEQDPRAAAEWAASLEDAEQYAAAMEGVAQGWARTDPAAAQQWVLDQPRGERRDPVLDALMGTALTSPAGFDLERLVAAYSSQAEADRELAEQIDLATRMSGPNRQAAIRQAEQMISLIGDNDLRRRAAEDLAQAR